MQLLPVATRNASCIPAVQTTYGTAAASPVATEAGSTAAGAVDQARSLKCELKTWESVFLHKHGRAPEKDDLVLYPEVADKYRRYSKLKRFIAGGNSKTAAPSGGDLPRNQPLEKPQPSDRLTMFPLETSTLTKSLKRKTNAAQIRDSSTKSPPKLAPQDNCCQTNGNQDQTASLLVGDRGDSPDATPKRQRTSMFFSAARAGVDAGIGIGISWPMIAEHENSALDFHQCNVDHTPATVSASATTTGADDVVHTDGSTLAFVPQPSLIRRYTQQRPNGAPHAHEPSPSSPHPMSSPLLSSFSVLSVSKRAFPESPLSRTAGTMRALELGIAASQFKARAGKLVKTTSIPLSTFGAQFRGASQIMSSQGHLSDGGECSGGGSQVTADPSELNASELVAEETNGDEEQPAGATLSAHKKKATQKRSTRRVKLQPVEKDGTIGTAKRSTRDTGSQHLVSSNFYKLKLKSGRRGPQSSDERRTALYKRMIGKKGSAKVASSSRSLVNESSRGSLLGMEDDLHEDDESDEFGVYDDGLGNEDRATRAKQGSRPTVRAARCFLGQCAVAGQPESFFSPDVESDSANVHTMSIPISLSLGYDERQRAVRIDLRKVLAHVWRFSEFKPGQVHTIKRVLDAQSTLLLLATGAGKSLAYQLPSLLLSSVGGGLTLVVTPLVSLMRDQIRHLPDSLHALCLSFESASKDSYADATTRLLSGQIQLLFVSPERLQSPRFQALMAAEGMPPIRLAVVDEAHCASEWSHNFRPAYLQLPGLLRALGTHCILAMTGTATAALASQLCKMFDIDPHEGIVRGDVVRDNIALSVVQVGLASSHRHRSTAREDALLGILRAPDMAALDSILVYVSTQATADRVAEYLTSRSIPAQSYHAGKPAAERTRIQAAFMREPTASQELTGRPGIGAGKHRQGEVPIRVLVATVAFGLGLNKGDIRAVVHFNLPRSMEAYVQEVGRAGRDGAPAHGIVLLATTTFAERVSMSDSSDPGAQEARSVDAVQIRSWAHSDGVDVAAVRRLLHKLFPASFVRNAIAAAIRGRASQTGPESRAWRVENTAVLELKALETDMDADQAVVQTLVSYLALKDPAMFELEPNTHRKCDVRFTRTELGKLAESHLFFAKLADYANSKALLATKPGRGGPVARFQGAKKTTMCAAVDIFDLASSMDLPASEVTAELYQWRAKREIMLEWQEPSSVVKVSLDMGRFAAAAPSDAPLDEPTSSAALCGSMDLSDDEWGEQLALRIDAYISNLAECICQQNESRVQDSLRKANVVEATMLAALQAARLGSTCSSAEADDLLTFNKSQSLLIQAAIKAYFAPSETECKRAVENLQALAGNPGNMAFDRIALERLSRLICGTVAPGSSETIAPEVRARIHRFAQQHCSELKTGRAIARIFHGLSSPACSSSQWMWCSEWGSLVWADFDAVRQCAQEELVRLHLSAIDHAVE